jgi:hypothetical protein
MLHGQGLDLPLFRKQELLPRKFYILCTMAHAVPQRILSPWKEKKKDNLCLGWNWNISGLGQGTSGDSKPR